MKKIVLVPFVLALAAALVPGAALAKGASEAEITGPGIKPISMAGEGQEGGEALMQLAEALGFFPAVFGQSPDPMLAKRPAGTLGPRYTITYVMPGPNNELDELRQYVYPYADPSPVSFTPRGQPFWTTERTRGGWFVATTSFAKDALVAAGLPKSPPGGGSDDGFPWPLASVLIAGAAVLALAGLGAYVIRRRPGTATAG